MSDEDRDAYPETGIDNGQERRTEYRSSFLPIGLGALLIVGALVVTFTSTR